MEQTFVEWLHDLTVLAYDKNVFFPSAHLEYIRGFYKESRTPEQALEAYIIETQINESEGLYVDVAP